MTGGVENDPPSMARNLVFGNVWQGWLKMEDESILARGAVETRDVGGVARNEG